MKINSSVLYICLLSFTISSCVSLGPWAYKNLPKDPVLDKTYTFQGKVIIIGAGPSGLAAAKICEQNGVDYQILEASDRYGGRTMKSESLADFPIDLGAEWIHHVPRILNRLKGKQGDTLDEVLIPYRMEETYLWDGQNSIELPSFFTDGAYFMFPESKFKSSTWYDYIDENFAKEVKHNIVYNAQVTRINYSDSTVAITTNKGETFYADKILVTVPIGVLQAQDIEFTPELKRYKVKAIQSVEFYPGFKLMLKFSEKFYPDVIASPSKTGERVFYDVAFKKETDDNILGILFVGSACEPYYKIGSDSAIVDSILTELDLIFDGKASETYMGEYILNDWGHHEYTKGTWSNPTNSKRTIRRLNRPLQNKVYFSGGANDISGQLGVPGAIISGYYSIDKLLTVKK